MDPTASPQPLVRSNTFTQQGSVDWGLLASKSVSYSIDILSRLSAANVNPLTIEVGSLIGCQFSLSSNGRANMRQALQSLTAYKSFGSVLWFGFGIRHVVYNMGATHEGFTCLALCAALTEFYPDSVSAEILNEMARSLGAPPRFTPSILQWEALLKTCAGIFAGTQLGLLIGQSLSRYVSSATDRLTNYPTQYECAEPNLIAETLQGIGAISRGEMTAIVVIGGKDIAWLAAVCQWLFSLSIEIRSPDGVSVYADPPGQDAQVTFILVGQYSEDPINSPSSRQLQSIQKTYVLHDPNKLFRSEPFLASGRVQWNNIFGTVFSSEFVELVQDLTQTLGTAIGSISRILLAIVSAEEGVPKNVIVGWPTYHPASFGRGFITQLLEQFPELVAVKKPMYLAARTSFQDAKIAYENQIKLLTVHCDCNVCANSETRPSFERFCLVVVVETIILLGYIFAEANVAPNLFPKAAAIRELYRGIAHERMNPKAIGPDSFTSRATISSLLTDFGPAAHVLDEILLSEGNHRMETYISLFTGSSLSAPEGSAISRHGICFYMGILVGGPSDDPEKCRKMHIVPGAIEYNEKPFSVISDDARVHSSRPKKLLPVATLYTKAETYLTETTESLSIHFRLTAPSDPTLEPLIVLPTELAKAISKSRGWVCCVQTGCKAICEVQEGENVVVNFVGINVRIIKGGEVARCAALIISKKHRLVALLRQDTCLQCCVKACANGNLSKQYFPTHPGNANSTQSFGVDESIIISLDN